MSANQIRRGYVDCEFGQLHYRIAGKDRKPWLVLIHQTPSSSVMYEPLMLELAGDFHIVAPDFPGFGQSDSLPVKGSIALYANALQQGLTNLGIKKAFLFGHHTGASIAVQMAYDRPKFVKAMALSGPTLLNEQQKMDLPKRAKPFVLKETGRHFMNMWERIRGKDNTVPLDLSVRETLLALALGEHYLEAYSGVAEQDFESQLAAVQCQTLVFAGTRDLLYATLDPSMDILKKKGTKAVIDGAATYVCETHTQEVAQLLKDFFNNKK